MRESCQTIGKIYATQYRYRGFYRGRLCSEKGPG